MMILGQCWGHSASVYALVATKGHVLEGKIGVLSQDITIYNGVNTIFFFMILNCFLYNSPSKFLSAYRNTKRSATDVMIQFPFYGGIMGMMTASGLGKAISDLLVQIGTKDSFYTLSFLSAGLLNMFVPSQGGQWIVQGPILVEAAQQLGANIPWVINAFVAGDECTNLLQPLYLIPALAIVGMKLKDAWGVCAFVCAFWLLTACVSFYILPMIFAA
jgi:short-chain fatty acids transporter